MSQVREHTREDHICYQQNVNLGQVTEIVKETIILHPTAQMHNTKIETEMHIILTICTGPKLCNGSRAQLVARCTHKERQS